VYDVSAEQTTLIFRIKVRRVNIPSLYSYYFAGVSEVLAATFPATLKMKAAYLSETLLSIYKATRRNNLNVKII
jgi:hypothetical protein